MKPSIQVRNIGKYYKSYPSQNARFQEWFLPWAGTRHEKKWVLREINLDVHQGESVGIIGMNGAGKSTLLKIIVGTTVPSTGQVSFHGSVSALLELGMGFHPEFTGRQNVFTSGQLMGYSRAEIAACMSHIEDFAEIGDAINAKVRTYSSGMRVRLAFSVATMKRPDILIVDEALSVGDTYFQHKSFSRIKEFIKKGTTLLFVSHSKAAVQTICNRAVLLDHGRILKMGMPEEIMDYYNAMLGDPEARNIQQNRTQDGHAQIVSGTGEARTMDIFLENAAGQRAEVFKVGEPVVLHVRFQAVEAVEHMVCGFAIKDVLGQDIYGTNTFYFDTGLDGMEAGEEAEVEFRFPLNIGTGNFSICVALTAGETHLEGNYEWKERAVVFQVVNVGKPYFVGLSSLDAEAVLSSRRRGTP